MYNLAIHPKVIYLKNEKCSSDSLSELAKSTDAQLSH